MNQKNFVKDLKQLIKLYKDYIKLVDKIFDLFGDIDDGPIDNLFDSYSELAIQLVEEKYNCKDIIGWFIFDNECGKVELKYNNKKIKNLNDLWGIINVRKN